MAPLDPQGAVQSLVGLSILQGGTGPLDDKAQGAGWATEAPCTPAVCHARWVGPWVTPWWFCPPWNLFPPFSVHLFNNYFLCTRSTVPGAVCVYTWQLQ